MRSGMAAYMDSCPPVYLEALIPGINYERSRDYWARNVSPNKDVRVYIGAYGAPPGTAGSGYVPLSTLASVAVQMRKCYPSFGGVALWDASLAYGEWKRSIRGLTHDGESWVMGGREFRGRVHF